MRLVGLPTTILIDYLEGVEKRDAEQYARNLARRVMPAATRVWYATARFWTGFLYEIHEGGKGLSFLQDLVRELNSDPGAIALLPSGRRLFQLGIRDGRPVGFLLPETKSRELRPHMALAAPSLPVAGAPYGIVVPRYLKYNQRRFTPVRALGNMRRLGYSHSPLVAASALLFLMGIGTLSFGAIVAMTTDDKRNTRSAAATSLGLELLPHR